VISALWALGGVIATIAVTWAALSAPQLVLPIIVALILVVVVYRSRRNLTALRLQGNPGQEQGIAWELVLLPLAVSIRQSTAVTVAALAVCLAIAIIRRAERQRHALVPWLLLLAAAALSVRTSRELLLIVALAFATVAFSRRKTTAQQAAASVTIGLAVYMIVNVAAHLVGLTSPGDAVRIGGLGDRILFPFARSINEPSAVFAIFIVLVAAQWMIGMRPTWIHLLGAVAGIYVVVESGSRAPAILAAVLVLAVLVAPRGASRALPIIVPVAVSVPFYLFAVKPALALAGDILASSTLLSRGQTGQQLADLSSRVPIWEGTTSCWTQAAGNLGRLVGWGLNGHATSGANRFYLMGQDAFLSNPVALTTHNTFLQTLLDSGIVGLIAFATALVLTLWGYSKQVATIPHLLAVSALALSGTIEVIAAPGPTATPFFMLVVFAAFVPTRPAQSPRTPVEMWSVPKKTRPSKAAWRSKEYAH